MENTLYYGDCLNVLKVIPSESVDLVYLDPPFNSKRDYNAFFTSQDGQHSQASIMAFEDTWHWGEQAQKEYDMLIHDPLADSLGENIMPAMRRFLTQSDMMAYLVMISSRLIELKRVLKSTGSLYLHCDPTASHYIKINLDGLFGAENFRNEIIWKRTSSHNRAKRWGPIHDTIFFYTKTNNYKWNKVLTEFDEEYIKNFYNHEDEYGKYGIVDLTGPGARTGDCGMAWRGINPAEAKRHWEVSLDHALPEWFDFPENYSSLSARERLNVLDEQGLVWWPKKENGKPRYKRYLTEQGGVAVQDIIYDIKPLASKSDERLGYPTQKPLALLERIIKSSSDESDIVLDPFCGCGTALHAAQKLKRKWIGIDITHLAVGLIKRRMHSAFPKSNFEVKGTPQDVESARFLAENNGNEGRYQFQYWALSLIDAVPSQDRKKGAHGGSDGFIWVYNTIDCDSFYKINISVKSGKTIPAGHIRELASMIGKNGVEICVLLSLAAPSRKMLADALSHGDYEYPNGKKFKRIQILTIEELLQGKMPDFLDYGEGKGLMRKARRENLSVEQKNITDFS